MYIINKKEIVVFSIFYLTFSGMKGSDVGDSSRKFLGSQEPPHCFDVKLVSMSLCCFLPFFTGEIFCCSVDGSISV